MQILLLQKRFLPRFHFVLLTVVSKQDVCFIIFHVLLKTILGHRRSSSHGSSVAAMQNIAGMGHGPHTGSSVGHPMQLLRGHSQSDIYGHPAMYPPPHIYCKYLETLASYRQNSLGDSSLYHSMLLCVELSLNS